MDRRNGVEPRDHPLHVGQGRDRDARRHVGAEVRPRAHAERDDPAARVERELARQDVIARLHVADEPLGSARHPLHRAPRWRAAHASATYSGYTWILEPNPPPTSPVTHRTCSAGTPSTAREIGGELMHALEPGVERVAAGVGVPFGQRGARLQKAGDEPIVDERQPRYVGGGGDGALGGLGVAALPVVREIAGRGRVHLGRALGEAPSPRRRPRAAPRTAPRRPRRRHAPLRRSRRRRIAMGSPTWRTRSTASGSHGGSANGVPSRLRIPPPRSAIKRRDRADAVGDEITPGKHAEHAGDRPRRCRVDGHHVGVSVRRAHERGMGLARRVAVLRIAAPSSQEPRVLAALDRRADARAPSWPQQ